MSHEIVVKELSQMRAEPFMADLAIDEGRISAIALGW